MGMLSTISDPSSHSPCTAAMLGHLGRLMRIDAEADLAPSGLRPRHLITLTIMREHDGLTQQALGTMLSMDGRNVVGLLNELELNGLVVRRRIASDRRKHAVELTPQGRRALVEAEAAVADAENRVLGALTPAQRGTLHDLLRRATAGHPLNHMLVLAETGADTASPTASHDPRVRAAALQDG